MTDRELMQMALEALEEIADEVFSPYDNELGKVILALRERLAQPEQEPVAWMNPDTPSGVFAQPWVGLTLEEIGLLTTGDGWAHLETPALALFARAIEAKLKEKNT